MGVVGASGVEVDEVGGGGGGVDEGGLVLDGDGVANLLGLHRVWTCRTGGWTWMVQGREVCGQLVGGGYSGRGAGMGRRKKWGRGEVNSQVNTKPTRCCASWIVDGWMGRRWLILMEEDGQWMDRVSWW